MLPSSFTTISGMINDRLCVKNSSVRLQYQKCAARFRYWGPIKELHTVLEKQTKASSANSLNPRFDLRSPLKDPVREASQIVHFPNNQTNDNSNSNNNNSESMAHVKEATAAAQRQKAWKFSQYDPYYRFKAQPYRNMYTLHLKSKRPISTCEEPHTRSSLLRSSSTSDSKESRITRGTSKDLQFEQFLPYDTAPTQQENEREVLTRDRQHVDKCNVMLTTVQVEDDHPEQREDRDSRQYSCHSSAASSRENDDYVTSQEEHLNRCRSTLYKVSISFLCNWSTSPKLISGYQLYGMTTVVK